MRAAHSWLGPDGPCTSIAGGGGVLCEKGLHGPVAADPQGDSYVQQLACEKDRPFSRYLLNRAGRDCAAGHERRALAERFVRVGCGATPEYSPSCDGMSLRVGHSSLCRAEEGVS